MTDLGTCDKASCGVTEPHRWTSLCKNWQSLSTTPRVEIWRFNDNTLTVARTDGACWNGPDTMFTGVVHDGVWDSKLMRFAKTGDVPNTNFMPHEYFSDGTPAALYEGQQPVIDLLDSAEDIQ